MKGDKKPNRKGKMQYKCEAQKRQKGVNKIFKKLTRKTIKEELPKIKVLPYELLAYTLSYLMLASW
jgi:hypothetical protein